MTSTTQAALAACALVLLAAPAAASAAPPQLWQKCDSDEPAGQQCSIPRGIAADRDNGRVYVADQSNKRILEFTAAGEFFKTWGWDVVASGPGDDTVAPADQFEVCVPEDGDTCKAGAEGTGAGQFASPQGVALDSAGNVYVVDLGIPSNNRVQKFSRAGDFLLAWGGDVVFNGPDDSSNDEEQELIVAASSGSFRLGLPDIRSDSEREETASLPFNASAAEIQAALNALPTIGGIGGSVSVTGASSPYLITFEGNLAGDDVPQLSVAQSVGASLKCSSPTAAESITYKWLRNGEPISGATASTYIATAADEGKAIQCQVTATNANAGSTQVSEPLQVIAPAPKLPPPSHPAPIAAPEASAPLNVGGGGGQTLSCDSEKSGWKDLGGELNYRWYRNGVKIDTGSGNATNPNYQVTAADLSNPAVFQCDVTGPGLGAADFETTNLETTKVSENLATVPPPSAPLAPEAQASTSPGNGVITTLDGGAPEICKPTDTCKGGAEGTANGEFGEWAPGSFIAITPTDKVYVGDEERIQRFDTGGVYQDEIALPGKTVNPLAVDSAGNLYYTDGAQIQKLSPSGEPLLPTFELPNGAPAFAIAVDAADHVYVFGQVSPTSGTGVIPTIFEFDSAGNVIDEFKVENFNTSTGLATNLCEGSEAPGNLYVSNLSIENAFVRAYGTDPIGCFKARTLPATDIEETAVTLNGRVDPSGSLSSECRFQYGTTTSYGNTIPCAESPAQIGTGEDPVPVHANLGGLQAGTVYHFRLRARIKGETETSPDEQFKTLGPPVISDDYTVSATDTEASLKALVNPEGFPTTYRIEYVTQADFEASGFEGAQSSAETAVGEDRTAHVVFANLGSLIPGTTYRWRIVATNTAVQNGGLSAGQAHTLFTYRLPAAETECPNQAFRTEASAFLPDCRAYEMVSPVDKNGGDIMRFQIGLGDTGTYAQASPDGESITYTSLSAFGELPAAANFNQYLASRQAGKGWSSRGIRPPVVGQEVEGSSDTLNGFRQFMGFTPDLCSGWLIDHQTPPMTAEGQEGYPNLYRRQNCGPDEGELETLTDVPMPEGTPVDYIDRNESVHGFSDDGSHALFVAAAKLTPEAPAGGRYKLYDRFGGAIHLVSVLPDGTPSIGQLGAGDWGETLAGAVSEDGSRVYWTMNKLFLRIHPEQGVVSGECSKASKACTVAVSAGAAYFWGASSDGSKAIYTEGGTLYEFDLVRQEAKPVSASQAIAAQVIGVAGTSEDLSHMYFVSRQAFAEAGHNSEGDEALAGAPNLYLYEAGVGSFSFVGTLSEKDVGKFEEGATGQAYDVVSQTPAHRATRVSADGSRITFISRAPLTGYDNTETATGKAAAEVFAYEAGGELDCASCNPSGSRPEETEDLRQSFFFPPGIDIGGVPTRVPAAAWIPGWEHAPHASNLLSADGNRLFFNAYDSLLPRDTNGVLDVYQWEAPGTGGCDEGDADYFPQNGGCLYLISTGESPYPSEFWEASTEGDDVFFTTASSLLPQDPGSIDLYNARVGGGFPQPAERAVCEGEACQIAPPPPNDPTPSSSSFRGPGNLSQSPPARCRKGKVRRRGRCVQKRKKRARAAAKRRANHERRAKR